MDLPVLWRFHQTSPFPATCLSLSVAGMALVRLDADVGACLTASLSTSGVPRKVDGERRATLLRGLGLVRQALREVPLEPEAREYFERLETLSLAVLGVRE